MLPKIEHPWNAFPAKMTTCSIGMAYSDCFPGNILSQSCRQNFGQHLMVSVHEKLVVIKNKEGLPRQACTNVRTGQSLHYSQK